MKKYLLIAFVATIVFIAGIYARQQQQGYVLIHEKDIAKEESGPHNGGGSTLAHNFFSGTEGLEMVFRKRILRAGSSIGYHLQKTQEIYYIVSGNGELTMNGKPIKVAAGDAILTKPGNSHGLKQTGAEDLVVIINYLAPKN